MKWRLLAEHLCDDEYHDSPEKTSTTEKIDGGIACGGDYGYCD